MLKIIKNSIFVITVLFYSFDALAKVYINDSISLYGTPKYTVGFKNFAFVNPNAPKSGKITLPEYGVFDSFNPFIFKGIAFSQAVTLGLETLGYTPIDDQASVYPLLAQKFEISDDNSFIGFILNPKAKFSDGSKVTADDVIFSFNALINQGSPFYKVYYSDVKEVKKISDNHVRFYFKPNTKNKELPLILSQFYIFSKDDFHNIDFSAPSLTPPLGSGAYKISAFEVGKFVEFTRRKDYWGQDLPTRRGFFNFDKVRYDFYQDTTVTLQALFSGAIDAREEFIAKIWAGGYNNSLVKDGKIKKTEMLHNNPANLQFFGFNTRLKKFSDRRVREAISLAFNFDWANSHLFYNQYQRIYSLFSNTSLAATGSPSALELSLLKKFDKNLLPPTIYTPYQLPDNSTAQKQRDNLKKAVKLLNSAGYDFVNGIMTNLNTGEALEIEVLSNSANGSSFTRVMLPFIENLRQIGIKMTFRNVEVNIFKNRLDNFEYEMAILSFRLSAYPGNEQREIWGSSSAFVKGSNNILGINNSIIDQVTADIINSKDKNKYLANVKILDRLIMHEYYFIPQWYAPSQRVAYRSDLAYPDTDIKSGFDIFTWWFKEK